VAPQAQIGAARAAPRTDAPDAEHEPVPRSSLADARHRRAGHAFRRAGWAPIPIDELEPRHLAAWRELAGRAAEPNPFFEPEFLLPAARHLGGSQPRLLVVRGPDGEWLAAMPVAPTLRLGRTRLPVLHAWRSVHAALGTPLVARDAVEPATRHLLERAFRVGRVGVVMLPWMGDGGPVATGLLAALADRGGRPALRRSFERAVMRRSTLAGGVEALLGGHHRRDLGRLGRRLGEQLGAPLEARDEGDRAGAVDRFLAVEASGWKGQRGTAFAASRAHDAFFRELCDGFRAVGRLQMVTLGTPERTVSLKCNLLAGDAVFFFKIAFDESFLHFRPGLQLEVRMLELFRDRMDQSWMDSCAAPRSPLFEHLWPERREIGSYVLAANRSIAWAAEHGAALLEHGSRS
jgi:CelD/BcsL family acetyltransferase involved in cellulose biosynthesis